jgi:hypothetical protein
MKRCVFGTLGEMWKENKLSGLNKIPSTCAIKWDGSKKQRGDLTRMKKDGKKAEEGKKK